MPDTPDERWDREGLVWSPTMPDTPEIAAIRERDVRASRNHEPLNREAADRRLLLAHIDALTAAVRVLDRVIAENGPPIRSNRPEDHDISREVAELVVSLRA